MKQYIFESPRLGFRQWRNSDRKPFAEMNACKEVMRFFPDVLSMDQSNERLNRILEYFETNDFGLWAVEIKETKEFIGFIGFNTAVCIPEVSPVTEIGWRLDNKYWNCGYATEGAKKCLDHGFNTLGFEQIYAYATHCNHSSINVIKKIGMYKTGEFNHPVYRDDSNLKLQFIFKIEKREYKSIIKEA